MDKCVWQLSHSKSRFIRLKWNGKQGNCAYARMQPLILPSGTFSGNKLSASDWKKPIERAASNPLGLAIKVRAYPINTTMLIAYASHCGEKHEHKEIALKSRRKYVCTWISVFDLPSHWMFFALRFAEWRRWNIQIEKQFRKMCSQNAMRTNPLEKRMRPNWKSDYTNTDSFLWHAKFLHLVS